jgi:hypothetical protein
MLNRLLQLSLLAKGHAEIVVRHHLIGIQLEGLLVGGHGGVQQTLGLENIAQIDVGANVAGFPGQSFPECSCRVVHLPRLGQRDTSTQQVLDGG